MTREVGRPTTLDEEMFLKIKELILDGKNMKEMSEILDIPYKTMEGWKTRNYEGFSDKVLSYQLERMFQKSIVNIEVLQDSEDERVSLQANLEVAKRIGKKYFSERIEQTGADGSPLVITFDESFKNKNATPNTTSETEGDSIK
jgi:hypothetical protein